MASDMKIKILNDMLAKGYIDEEEYREKLNDECFSEYDAAIYQHIEEAYADADNGNYTMDEIKRYIQDELNINFK